MDSKIEPRGIRNNNPLNIRTGSSWKGLRKSQSDGQFCQFESMTYGIRAAMILIANYITGHNASARRYTTPRAIISRWAPSSENNTEAYIRAVCAESGIGQFEPVPILDKTRFCHFVAAMAHHECGVLLPLSMFLSTYDLISFRL